MVDPPSTSPINGPLTINYLPSRTLTVNADGDVVQIHSSARIVGEALAEAGIPLVGLDYSLPSENEALPSDGNIKVVSVTESVILTQKPIPFESELIASSEVPLDQTQILSPGETGLSIQRVRVRYEDGQEVSRVTEDETLVRPPKTRTIAYGTKVEVKTEVVNGVEIEYWRAVHVPHRIRHVISAQAPAAPQLQAASNSRKAWWHSEPTYITACKASRCIFPVTALPPWKMRAAAV
jgi:uncharacterized protein YabE (DUF348 family)